MIEQPHAPEAVYRNRQTWWGMLVRPRQQVRIALVYIAATWLVHAALLAALLLGLDTLNAWMVAGCVFASATLLSLFSLLAGVLLSHRIFGPIVSVKRHIASLREGQYTARLQLRSTDDLSELKDALNDLASALESRHGPGPRTPS